MKNLTFPEKTEGNQTPMLREQARTPIYNKINMSHDYQSWLKYKSNIKKEKQQFGMDQQQNNITQISEDQVEFKRKIEDPNDRIIFCVDRNAVNVQPLTYTIDEPMTMQNVENDQFVQLTNNQQNNLVTEISHQASLNKITELQPDEEDLPFEDYQDFLMEDPQKQKDLNVNNINSQNEAQQTQITRNIAIEQNKQQHITTDNNLLNTKVNSKENVIVMLPKSNREEIIQNKVSTHTNINQINEQKFQSYSNQHQQPQKYYEQNQNNIQLLSEEYIQNPVQIKEQHQQTYQNQTDNSQDKNPINISQNYKEQLLQSNEQYDPVESILNKYQYKGDQVQQNTIHQNHNDNQNYPYSIQQHIRNSVHQNQENISTKKFVVIDGQRIPYDEYYKNKQTNYKPENIQQRWNTQQEIVKTQNQYIQNEDKKTKHVNFIVPEDNLEEKTSNTKILDENEKLKRLQQIKQQLKQKEQEQNELNSRLKNIYGEIEQEKSLQKSLEMDYNSKNEQIQQLRQQNEQLRKKINHHYQETPVDNLNDEKQKYFSQNKITAQSQQIEPIKKENEETKSGPYFNKFDTFGQTEILQNQNTLFQNTKQRDQSPGMNLRRVNQIIPSQQIPSNYRPPTYDSTDQQQFSQFYNQ